MCGCVCVGCACVCVCFVLLLTKGLLQRSYLENAFVALLATMAQRQMPVASWLNAVHEAAREAHPTSGSLCMPDRLKHTTLAGCRITPEVSTAVTSNRLCAMLAPDGAYGECDMLRASDEAGPHIVAGVNDVAPSGKARATALMFAALAVSSRKLDERTAGPHASAVLPHEVYRRRGVESALRMAAKSRVEAFADSGKHFISVVLVVPGYTRHFVEAVTATIGAVRVVPGYISQRHFVEAVTPVFWATRGDVHHHRRRACGSWVHHGRCGSGHVRVWATWGDVHRHLPVRRARGDYTANVGWGVCIGQARHSGWRCSRCACFDMPQPKRGHDQQHGPIATCNAVRDSLRAKLDAYLSRARAGVKDELDWMSKLDRLETSRIAYGGEYRLATPECLSLFW